LREIAARDPSLRGDAFAKVGDSMTASDDFLRCFANPSLELGEHAVLRPVIERFRESFRHSSAAARIGWSVWQVLAGSPAPIERELDARRPRFAFVQFGTNDLELGRMKHFVEHQLKLTDALIERGVIPILFTIPARKDRSDRGVWVPRYNAMIRAIAQARRVPLVDFYRELARLPGQGLAKDGIHPSTYQGPRGRDACDLGAAGLRHGYNLRNLLALQALDRALHGLAGEPLDPAPPARDPLRVAELPFVDARRVAGSGLVYRFAFPRTSALRATLFARAADTELELTRAAPSRVSIVRGHESVASNLAPGAYELKVSAASAEELFLTVLSE